LDEYKIITGGLKESADNLKNILSNNQLRGKYGEEVAENLLKSVGFVRGQNYVANESQDTAATRPDFTIFLPDGTKVNVDAKFPLSALIKYQESEDKTEKERYLREFTADVKQKIKQVTTRDYINPEEKTVDFVILFVPNEMIFSFIYDRLNEAWDEAMKKKVIMAGPFSFTAILRMIFQSYKNFKYQENLYDIIKLIKVFEQEYEKFNAALDILGTRIQSAANQYQTVSVTRTKKLSGVVEKIKGENVLFENGEESPQVIAEAEQIKEEI
jgi:DNA recombination protein RmuC